MEKQFTDTLKHNLQYGKETGECTSCAAISGWVRERPKLRAFWIDDNVKKHIYIYIYMCMQTGSSVVEQNHVLTVRAGREGRILALVLRFKLL